jgi:ABC-2 type transport system ATP-binding protein
VTEPSIVATHLCRRFGDFKAVDDVSFHVDRGEIFGYLGANGAGKSTTIRMLCGLLAPSSGEATVAGFSIASEPEQVKASIGYMSQKFSLYLDLAVEDNVEFFGGAYGLSLSRVRPRMDEVFARLDLDPYRGQRTGSLPGGIRQRLALGCALLHEPEIVFLDEPTAGVDPTARRAFWSLIRALAQTGTTVFVTTHYMDEAEYCQRIGLMVDGRLVALDTPGALRRDHVPGEIFGLHGDALLPHLPEVRRIEGVIAATAMGAAVRVRVEPGGQALPAVIALLERSGRRVERVEPAESTLEDVFLGVVGKGRA